MAGDGVQPESPQQRPFGTSYRQPRRPQAKQFAASQGEAPAPGVRFGTQQRALRIPLPTAAALLGRGLLRYHYRTLGTPEAAAAEHPCALGSKLVIRRPRGCRCVVAEHRCRPSDTHALPGHSPPGGDVETTVLSRLASDRRRGEQTVAAR